MRLFSAAMAVGVLTVFTGVPVHADTIKIDALKGAWQGKGTIHLADNKSERLRCKVYYTGKTKNELSQAIICASSSYRVELRSKLVQVGEALSGTWEERSFGAEGEATGHVRENGLTLNVKGNGFTGTMTVSLKEENQSVEINTDGISLKKVAMTLSRF